MICGIDEAGRGPLAGPVCAAAVILSDDFPTEILNDSKKLSVAKRDEARRLICAKALAWGVGWASHTEIDEINILQASLLAMKRAFEQTFKFEYLPNCAQVPQVETPADIVGQPWPQAMTAETPFGMPLAAPLLAVPPSAGLSAIVDGLYTPDISIPCEALVKADAKVPEVMAASILAKTARDRLMDYYGRLYPGYGYEKHKGYPTRAHRELVLRLGPSPIQRMSFRVRNDGNDSR
ncbi:ribonuclease HII [Spirochaetia bacterium]|nr:ribonuclease HII [Spirochaetia bacterium]